MKIKPDKPAKPAKQTEEEILFPGRVFQVEGGTITVCPLGISQLKKFSGTLVRILGILGAEDQKQIVAYLLPHILTSALDLFEDCCIVSEGVDFNRIPHYEFPPMLEVWIEESFGEPRKWRPWMTMIESLILRITGKQIDLSEELSNLSLEQDTPETTS
jgi:hypothetical protein